LKVVDDQANDTGSLTSWTLTITYDDTIIGTAAGETLTGTATGETIRGLAGNDTLLGKEGNDILIGNRDADVYVFDTALNATTNLDEVVGFSRNQDTMHLDDAIFTGLALGALKKKNFTIDDKATSKKHFIIYDDNSGLVYFDADGKKGGSQQIAFAQLEDNLNLTHKDFFVI